MRIHHHQTSSTRTQDRFALTPVCAIYGVNNLGQFGGLRSGWDQVGVRSGCQAGAGWFEAEFWHHSTSSLKPYSSLQFNYKTKTYHYQVCLKSTRMYTLAKHAFHKCFDSIPSTNPRFLTLNEQKRTQTMFSHVVQYPVPGVSYSGRDEGYARIQQYVVPLGLG